MCGHLFRRRDHERNIRILGLPERCGHTDHHRVAPLQDGEVGGRLVPATIEQRHEIFTLDIRDVGSAGVQGRDPVEVGLDSGHGKPSATKLDGQGETHVPLADDGESCLVILDAVGQMCVSHQALHRALPS